MRPVTVFKNLLALGLCLTLTGSLLAQEPSVDPVPVKVVLVEDPDSAGTGRLHYPLLINNGKGFKIKCASQGDEEKVIRGLGLISMPSVVLDPLSEEVVNSRPDEQPPICPTAANFKIKLYRHNPGTGEQFYMQFPINLNERSYVDALYVAGCAGLLTGLKLDPATAINADPTPFFGDSIYKLDCFTGSPVATTPKSFTEWCLKPDLSPEQKKTVNALLSYTPAGVGALGDETRCKEADAFLTSLTTLNLSLQQLTDLSPLSSFKGLTQLVLANNRISDLSPLSSLRSLTLLNLSKNKIQNVSSLAALSQLTDLNLNGNTIVDVRPLSSISALKKLNLSENGLIDLSLPSVSYLTTLKELNLSKNQIVNPAPLADLIGLEKLDLSYNRIDSIASLSTLATTVNINVEGNPLNTNTFAEFCAVRRSDSTPVGHTVRELVAASQESNCSAAASRLQSQANLSLEGKGIVDITPLKFFTNLRDLNLSNNSVENVTTLAGLTQLNRLNLMNNNIRNVDPLGSLVFLTDLNLKGNPVELKSYVAWCLLSGDREKVSEEDAKTIEIVNRLENPKKCGESDRYLGRLNRLYLANAGIKSLRPLAALKHLGGLYLAQNQVTDLSPLRELTNLVYLDVSKNPDLVDLAPISSLTNLESLWIHGTKVKSLRPLGSMGKLKVLEAAETQVESLDGLQNKTQLHSLGFARSSLKSIASLNTLSGLKYLDISNTQVRDIQPLAYAPLLESAGLSNLNYWYRSYLDYCLVAKFFSNMAFESNKTTKIINEVMQAAGVDPRNCVAANDWAGRLNSLTLNNKDVKDLAPLAYFPDLKNLYINGNGLTSLAPLAGLTKMEILGMNQNQISDVTPLGNMKQLKKLYANENKIVSVSALAGLPALVRLELKNNQIVSSSPLASLSNLANHGVLDLSFNKIHNVSEVQSLISYAVGRGAVDTNKSVGVYLKGNGVCNVSFTPPDRGNMSPDRWLDAINRVKNLNTVKTRSCNENAPLEFIIINPDIIRPIRPIFPIRPGIIGGN